jgi:uncharacterized membrane protein YdjX (TVP38/TMEM64 family)
MSWLRIQHIKKHKFKTIIYLVVVIFFVSLIFYFGDLLKAVFTSPDAVRAWVLGYGIYAPVALFLLQVAQVAVAPLNNFIINFAGGYIFGPWMGFVYNYVGWIVGAVIVFWFSRFFGRGFVNLFVKEKKLIGFDEIMAKGKYIVFMLLLLPGPPDDFLVYFIGLSNSIRFRTFLWMVVIGKIPGKIATSFLGAGVAAHSTVSVAIYVIFIMVSVITFWKKPELWQVWQNKKKT